MITSFQGIRSYVHCLTCKPLFTDRHLAIPVLIPHPGPLISDVLRTNIRITPSLFDVAILVVDSFYLPVLRHVFLYLHYGTNWSSLVKSCLYSALPP